MSATLSEDVKTLKKLVLHNAVSKWVDPLYIILIYAICCSYITFISHIQNFVERIF